MSTNTRAMKMTTLRVGKDLWTLLEQEASLDGVSVSQYIREAALARAVASATARGETAYGAEPGAAHEDIMAAALRNRASDKRTEALALLAQSEQAKRVSKERRARSQALLEERMPRAQRRS